jgi:hypothetical protein
MEDPRGYAYRRKADWPHLAPDEFGALMSGLASIEARCEQFAIRRRLRRRRLEAVALFQRLRGPFIHDWWFAHPFLSPPRHADEFPKFPFRLMWNLRRHDT